MALTIGIGSKTTEAISPISKLVTVEPAFYAELCATLALPASVVLIIYNAKHSELVLATSCQVTEGVSDVKIQRAWAGTSARYWDFDTCVRVESIIPGEVCPDPRDTGCCGNPLDGVSSSGCIVIDKTNPAAPIIKLPPSGVVAGDYCGLTVNACGLVTNIDSNWPASCLPAFNPCTTCCQGGTGTGGPTAAIDVAYAPRAGAVYALGTNLQSSVDQLDAALSACCGSTVATVNAGSGIAISGSATNPVVNLTSVFAQGSGPFDGFFINPEGRVTSYVAPPIVPPAGHIGAGALQVNYNSGSNTFTYLVNPATTTVSGAMTLANAAQIAAGTSPPGYAVTVGNWQDVYNKNITPTVFSGGLDLTSGTATLDLFDLVSTPTLSETDSVAITNSLTSNKISKANLSRDVGFYAGGHYKGLVSTLTASRNVASMTTIAPGHYRVTMASALVLPTDYSVYVSLENQALPWWYTFVNGGPAVFDIKVFTGTNTPFDPVDLRFHVMSAN